MTDTSYRSSFMTVLAASMALAATVPCPAAAQELGRLAVEGFAGPARVVEYFTTDCCGPTRSRSGFSTGVRLRLHPDARVSPALDLGVTSTRDRDIRWVMALAAIAGGAAVAPTGHAGAGIVWLAGDCLGDASDTSPECSLDAELGARQPWAFYCGSPTAGQRGESCRG